VPPFDWKKWLDRLTPLLALGLGILSQAFAHHTIAFAPKAVALLALSWTLAAGIGQRLPESKPGAPPPSPWRVRLHAAAGMVTVSLFRNVLFFLVPIWFASATVLSLNVLAPVALAAMALLSCFPRLFRERVIDKPRVRTLWCSVVLFVALVPAAAVETSASPRLSAALAAALSWLVASLVTSRRALQTGRGRAELAGSAAVAALLAAVAAPLLPPVPVACRASAFGTAIHNKEIEGIATKFPAGTKRVYAWFAVHVPPRYRQGIRFEWTHEGRAAGHMVAREIVGGREEGYRIASSTNAPAAGSWRVDLLTDGSQLIARERFDVE
jgi:hypothetical protein